MNVLIIGASSKTSVGYFVGQVLAQERNKVVYASRSGRLGVKCDINSPRQLRTLLQKEKPEVVINAAGLYVQPQIIGSFSKWQRVKEHILAKSFGSLVLLDGAARVGVKKVIMLGGRAISSHSGFSSYSIGNGALWASVAFTNRYTKIEVYYLDIPPIKGSTIVEKLVAWENEDVARKIKESAIDIADVALVIKEILWEKYKRGTRIKLREPISL